MSSELPLKSIAQDGIAKAIEKAEHYRLLNEPEEAESICHDVLAVDPANQRALRTLVLALTDQFAGDKWGDEAIRQAEKLTDEYERVYYTGIVIERQARARLRTLAGTITAYDDFRAAMTWYERAEQIRPSGNDDALLRWNSCVRTIRHYRLQPAPQTDSKVALDD